MRTVLAMLVVAATAAPGSANVGSPNWGGDRAGELVGIIDVAIAREELVIDLRPLADHRVDKLVRVSATYHLDNRGDAKPLELVFATGSTANDLRIALDGQPIATRSSTAKLPESWTPPKTTPLFDGTALPYELRDDRTMPIGFALVVPPGRHDLVVAYGADPVRYHLHEPTVVYQFGYVLSPARSWASFGGLDLTVHVPAGWRAAVTPALTRDGDTLHGVFAQVPADTVALTVQASTGAYGLIGTASLALLLLVVIAGLAWIVMRTRAAERRLFAAGRVPSGWAPLGRGLAWGVAILAAGLFAIFGPDLALPDGQADHRGYGQGFAVIALLLGSLLAIVIGAVTSWVVGRRVNAPRP